MGPGASYIRRRPCAVRGWTAGFHRSSSMAKLRSEVGWQCRRRGRPCEDANAFERVSDFLVGATRWNQRWVRWQSANRKLHGNRWVLAHLIYVVVHAQFVVGQRGFIVPAVWQNSETTVC